MANIEKIYKSMQIGKIKVNSMSKEDPIIEMVKKFDTLVHTGDDDQLAKSVVAPKK